MGESKIELIFTCDVTIVLWNLADYPIPHGADLRSIRFNIEGALNQIGFDGLKQIRVFSDHIISDSDVHKFREAGIIYYPDRSKILRDFKIPLKMVRFAASSSRKTNFLVLAKQRPESELLRVQQCLKSRKHHVLVVDDTAQGSLLLSAPSIVDCTHVFGGGKPVKAYRSQVLRFGLGANCDNDAFDASKMINFSEPIKHANGDRTAVFWDAEDCPFPLVSPDEIYGIIESALRGRGSVGHEISIWAYVDENNKDGPWSGECLHNKTWDSRIYFLPGGDKASRGNRMVNDILLWYMDSPFPAVVLVFSDQERDGTFLFQCLKSLSIRSYQVFLVTPTPDINKPESPEWPELLLDEACFFGASRESSEPNPKKHKPDL